MLAVTDNAATAIRDMTSQQEVPDGAGLRIAADAYEGALTLSLVAEPYEGDEVIDSGGALVYLDSLAADLLYDQELDVAVDSGGSAQFSVADQSGSGFTDQGGFDEPYEWGQ